MDRNLIDKYFRDQCTQEELEQVLDWFQTEEGQAFLQEDIEQQNEQLIQNSKMFLYPEVESEKVFSRIQLNKKTDIRQNPWFYARVASILFLVALFSGLLYWGGLVTLDDKKAEPTYATYVTEPDQQKVLTLSDGTKIRLNENATLILPEKLNRKRREVELQGEAYFEVAHDKARPFMVKTTGSVIEVLGTKFNVKADSAAKNVQVAVTEGKVSLRSGISEEATSALLTRNNFGVLRLSDSRITIEQTNAQNYLSWINNRLQYSDETLARVSRQLERLYGVEITFASERLKHLQLTADIEKTNLQKVLDTICNTFDIRYKMNGHTVVWMT